MRTHSCAGGDWDDVVSPARKHPIWDTMPAPAQSDDPANRPTPEREVADSLVSGLLLAFSGGSLDAFLYRNHGHVFAGAMTGNAVLCGIGILGDDPREALQHFLPIVAFILGVWSSELLQDRLKHHAVAVGLACEAGGLIVCSFLSLKVPNLVFNPLISLLAAYQVASFRQVDSFAYNSTFITGDLRTAIVGVFRAVGGSSGAQTKSAEDRDKGFRQARDLGLVLALFIGGAVAGSVLAPHAGNRTLWLPASVLLVVLGLTVMNARPAAARQADGRLAPKL